MSTNSQMIEQPAKLELKRAQTRERVRRHRENRGREIALASALAEVVDGQTDGKRALLKSSLLRHGVTVDGLIEMKAQALKATRIRKVGNETVEVPDFPVRLRTIELLTEDFVRAGDIPTQKESAQLGGCSITLNVQIRGESVATGEKIINAESLTHE